MVVNIISTPLQTATPCWLQQAAPSTSCGSDPVTEEERETPWQELKNLRSIYLLKIYVFKKPDLRKQWLCVFLKYMTVGIMYVWCNSSNVDGCNPHKDREEHWICAIGLIMCDWVTSAAPLPQEKPNKKHHSSKRTWRSTSHLVTAELKHQVKCVDSWRGFMQVDTKDTERSDETVSKNKYRTQPNLTVPSYKVPSEEGPLLHGNINVGKWRGSETRCL